MRCTSNSTRISEYNILTLWSIWKERNGRIFQHKIDAPQGTLAIIKEEAEAWIISGASSLATYLPGRGDENTGHHLMDSGLKRTALQPDQVVAPGSVLLAKLSTWMEPLSWVVPQAA